MLFNKRDAKDYLLFSSSSIINILKISSRIYILPSVILYPSNACNYNCIMCTNAKNKVKDREMMDFSLIKKTIDDCSRFLFKPQIHFSGLGEPLIYPRIRDAIKLCSEKGLKWSMTTNGYFLERYADDIILNDCKAINISIHGDSLEHDKISGVKYSFEKVIKGIKKLNNAKKRLKRSNPLIAINCVFNNENIPQLKKILGVFGSLPINSITFQHIIFLEEDLDKNMGFVIKDQKRLDNLIEFTEFVKKSKFPIKVNVFPKIKKNDISGYYTDKCHEFKNSCIIPWLSVRIHPNGDIKSCFQSFGNIKNNSLKSIINNEKALKFRDMVRKGKFKIPFCFRCCHRHYY